MVVKEKGPGPREAALREMREKRAEERGKKVGPRRAKLRKKVVAKVRKKIADLKTKRRGR